MHELEGLVEGVQVGLSKVGELDGLKLGFRLGEVEGESAVGVTVGKSVVGFLDGASVVGPSVGYKLGECEGASVNQTTKEKVEDP